MNANELADELTDLIVAPTPVDDKWACELIDEAATMLRQQQNEIEDLKNANRFIENFAEEQHQRAVALEMRELTDKEIEKVFYELDVGHSATDFAKAILRKAQEK